MTLVLLHFYLFSLIKHVALHFSITHTDTILYSFLRGMIKKTILSFGNYIRSSRKNVRRTLQCWNQLSETVHLTTQNIYANWNWHSFSSYWRIFVHYSQMWDFLFLTQNIYSLGLLNPNPIMSLHSHTKYKNGWVQKGNSHIKMDYCFIYKHKIAWVLYKLQNNIQTQKVIWWLGYL